LLSLLFQSSVAFPNLPVQASLDPPPSFVIVEISGTHPPTWHLAAWVVRLVTAEEFGKELKLPRRRVYYGTQKLKLDDPDLTITAVTLEFSFPYWVKNLTVEIWG
jgi:hypothetical protein